MTKLLFFILLGVIGVAWFKSQSKPRRDIERPHQSEVEDMVRCHVCGINLPRSEAILSKGRIYCCDDHRCQDQG